MKSVKNNGLQQKVSGVGGFGPRQQHCFLVIKKSHMTIYTNKTQNHPNFWVVLCQKIIKFLPTSVPNHTVIGTAIANLAGDGVVHVKPIKRLAEVVHRCTHVSYTETLLCLSSRQGSP
jgi:hypothetical protein